MLNRAHRLVNPLDFRRVVRRGQRASGKFVAVHMVSPLAQLNAVPAATVPVARIGFVVSKAVGPAVVRNLVKRRLRAIVSEMRLEPGSDLVVRALPSSASATFLDLESELTHLVAKAQR